MKIAFLHSSLRAGGVEDTIAKLSNYLVGQSCKVVVVLTQREDRHYILNDQVKCIEVSERHKKAAVPRAILNNINNMVAARNAIVKEKPDVLICMNSSIVIYGVFATLFTKTKVIGAERSNPYISMRGTVWYYVKFIASLFADGYVFQTTRASMFYPACVRNKSIIIENALGQVGVNKYNPNSLKISAVGSLRNVKGFDILIDAFSKLPTKYHAYTLFIYGDGELRHKLEKQILDCSLKNRVILAGLSDNILQSINDSCLYVLSSFHEGMPNSLMEAMSLGLPCISTDCPMGPRELISDGGNGVLVPVGDSSVLANTMEKVLSDRNFRIQLSQKAIAINETNSLEIIGGKWLEYIKKIVAK